MCVKFFRVRKLFRAQLFAGLAVFSFLFKITVSKMSKLRSRLLFYQNLLISRLLTNVFVYFCFC